MFTIIDWIRTNWEIIIHVGVLLFLLSISGTLTQTLRSAKQGLKEFFTPLGFIIFLVLALLAYQIYLSIMDTL